MGVYNNLLRVVEDDSLRTLMGETAPGFMVGKFSLQRLANDLRQLYYRLLDKKS